MDALDADWDPLLCLDRAAGLYVVTTGVLVVFVASIGDAWVLLVEVLR